MKKIIGIVVLIIFAGGLLAGGIYTLNWMKQPLDPPLELDVPAEVSNAIAASQPQSPQNQQKFCGNTGTMAIMLSGVSMPEWRPVHGIGALRLVLVDFSNKSASILSVPRALYADTSGLDVGVDEASLTVAYRLARDAATGNNPDVINRKATEGLAQVLVDDFGYVPDKYITVDPAPFVDLVDLLDGIDIHLDDPIDGTPDDLPYFEAGDLHLDGQETLDFLRIIHPAGVANPTVWQKFSRQTGVAIAICKAMLKLNNWPDIPEVIKDARKMVVTDLSVSQATDLVCMINEVRDGAQFEEVPPQWVDVIDEEQIQIDPDHAQDVEDLFLKYSSEKK